MLGRICAATLRSYTTLVLLVFSILLPLHLIYAVTFNNVFSVRELHGAIEEFPPSRQVRGVGRDQLARARAVLWALTALELALTPLLVRAVRRVIEDEERESVPTVGSALSAIRSGSDDLERELHLPAIVGAAILMLVVAVAAELTLLRLTEMLPDEQEFAGVAVAQAVGRAMGAPFLLVALTGIARRPVRFDTDLY